MSGRSLARLRWSPATGIGTCERDSLCRVRGTFSQPVVALGERVFLLDLAQINGIEGVIQRLPPDIGGVYAWFRGFPEARQLQSSTVEWSLEYLTGELVKAQMPPRRTRIPPFHGLELYWDSPTSDEKWERTRDALGRTSFREAIGEVLELAFLLEGPLYVGAARNLPVRIRQHLDGRTPLRERLGRSDIDISDCRLVIVGLDGSAALRESGDATQLEELVSRLFAPEFNERIG